MSEDIWPSEVRLSQDKRTLFLQFTNGERVAHSAERLRVESPSAEVHGHGPGQKVDVTGKENVKILRIEPMGNYAVKLYFDDGHDTGIYTWRYLHALGRH
ncbi:MAG: DUF971 domain-containing protein [Alphaproteobacteria bacterium]|nr:DUF971 domain-containing protein [Alphaproteobacteria bacterium]